MSRAAVQELVADCSVDSWVVTAPYLQPRHAPSRGPWGAVHVKQNGALLTACGELAVGWYSFWDHPFAPEVAGACPPCLSAMHRPAQT